MRQQSYGEWTYEGGARSESLVVADGNPTRYKGERIRCVERAIFAKPGGTAGLFLIFSCPCISRDRILFFGGLYEI